MSHERKAAPRKVTKSTNPNRAKRAANLAMARAVLAAKRKAAKAAKPTSTAPTTPSLVAGLLARPDGLEAEAGQLRAAARLLAP